MSGLDFMIGGKDSCQGDCCEIEFTDNKKVMPGDSGGPMWTREQVGGETLAYLVSRVGILSLVTIRSGGGCICRCRG